jgi:ribulose-phosphate 3-epimerase
MCEAHLMVNEPDRFFADYKRAGMSRLIVHVETCPHLYRTLQEIRALDMQAGVTLNPLTPISAIEEAMPLVDLILVMSVEPGFGGQSFITGALRRIERLRRMLDDIGSSAELEVDGGVNVKTIRQVKDAGASIAVVGAAVFNDNYSIDEGIRALRAEYA